MAEPKPHQLKHLDYIQAIITRMAQHSFALKGWCSSLVLAFIGVLIKEGAVNPWCWTPALPVICCFWGLDAYYLRREKLFRALYDKVSQDAVEQKTTFNMMLDVSFLSAPSWKRILVNHTIWPVYAVPAALILVVALVVRTSPTVEPKASHAASPAVISPPLNKVPQPSRAAQPHRPFDAVFEEIMKTASPAQRYQFLYELPKGADLHNHLNLSILPEAWLQGALGAEQHHGNVFFTRTKFAGCKDTPDPPVLYRTLQRSSYQLLSDCQRGEYEPLTSLTPALRAEWLSALTIDKPGEGREEFFEVLSVRLGDLGRDPYLVGDLLVDNVRRFGAEGVRYLEVQVVGPRFLEKDGKPIDEERGVQLLAARLAQPDAKATGVIVRFLASVVRFLPTAEQDLERAFALVDRHRDLWVGVNLTGREDKDAGRAVRFLETVRKLRRTYGDIKLALHGGETEAAGTQIRDTLLLGATRVGHALNLASDPSTLLLMRDGKFLVETSLISNRLLGYVSDTAVHPFAEYLRMGIPICLNTDDRGAWDSNLTDEYYIAVNKFNLRWDEIKKIGRNSVLFSFADNKLKSSLLDEYEKAIDEFELKFNQITRSSEKLTRPNFPFSKYAIHNIDSLGSSSQ